ncbi:MAG: nitrilase-related carbon-nitrogen hydrolase [Eubacterium sp.]|nr:nitrilase-related carbon-nitrogen hydrolase [Eubacterium sp.]
MTGTLPPLSAGSIPECDDAGHIYNTAFVFDREGKEIACHRKMHLFDIDYRRRPVFS